MWLFDTAKDTYGCMPKLSSMSIIGTLASLSPEVLLAGVGVLALLGLKAHDKAVWSEAVPVSQPRRDDGTVDTTPWRKLVRAALALAFLALVYFTMVGVNSAF